MAEVSIQKNGALKFDFVAPQLYEILCGIREAAETPDPRVEARFFPEPSEGDDSLAEDWKAFVQPDLHEGFQSARETVAADLRGAKERKTGHFTFTIPKAHIDAWLSALNQARLALAEAHGFGDAEMSRGPRDQSEPRETALFRLMVYGLLQERLVATLD
jgi:hypothetical protein